MSIELIILAAVAVFVIQRLYAVLGQKSGTEPTRRLREVTAPAPDLEAAREEEERPRLRPAFTGPGAAGLEAIAAADPGFSPDDFVKGARRAYELIVTAYADGDRAALSTLVDEDVYEAYDAAITSREKSGGEPLRLARLKVARIVDASLTNPSGQASEAGGGQIAKVEISFEAELNDGEKHRLAREIWTFKRAVTSSDPNWLLDEVATAS